jgi:hypothetical protein
VYLRNAKFESINFAKYTSVIKSNKLEASCIFYKFIDVSEECTTASMFRVKE